MSDDEQVKPGDVVTIRLPWMDHPLRTLVTETTHDEHGLTLIKGIPDPENDR